MFDAPDMPDRPRPSLPRATFGYDVPDIIWVFKGWDGEQGVRYGQGDWWQTNSEPMYKSRSIVPDRVGIKYILTNEDKS